MLSVVITSFFNPNIYYKSIVNYNYKSGTKFVFKIKDLKELKKKEYLCPQDAKHMGSDKNTGAALSIILIKPYYTDISAIDRSSPSGRWAVPSKKQISSPCINEQI